MSFISISIHLIMAPNLYIPPLDPTDGDAEDIIEEVPIVISMLIQVVGDAEDVIEEVPIFIPMVIQDVGDAEHIIEEVSIVIQDGGNAEDIIEEVQIEDDFQYIANNWILDYYTHDVS